MDELLPALPPEMTGGPEDEEGLLVDLEMEESEVEELPDGSAIVKMDISGPDENEDFYSNMAESMPETELSGLALKYLDLIEKDKEARKKRDEQYEEGIRRTGLGNDAPGGANFQGASKVVHPVMAEACIDFMSRAIKELFPPDGPVRTQVLGEASEDKTEVAERKRDYMNWQLTEQIEEFRDEMEQMLTQLPLGGSQYMKLWYDDHKKRPCAEFIPIDNMIIPFSAANFYTSQRAAEVHNITQQEFERRISAGLYRDVSVIRATAEPEPTAPEKANRKVEGKNPDDNVDGVRTVYHVYVNLEEEDDKYSNGEMAPYIMMIDEEDRTVVGLYRNWEESDETMTKLDWIIEFKFIPWRGALAIGLPHLIGGLSAALTGALRALMDSAHITNAATMLKLKGARISGQSQQVEVTQVTEIEGAPGVDDIRKIAMPMPFNPPSPILFQLLGWLTDAAKGVVTTSEEKIADVNANAPVGTTQALIEQGAHVFSSIHARLHHSQTRLLKVLGRINRWYLEDMRKGDIVAELPIRREDFVRNTDVIPVSDPHIFSETQRMAQNQAVIALDKAYPGVMDATAIVKRSLKMLKVPNIAELMPNMPEPEEMNAAEENVSMSLGRGAFAYPHQNHLAHLQTHLDYAMNPIYGSNPLIAPAFTTNAMEHIKQHLVLWYSERMRGYVEQALGRPVKDYDMPEITDQVDKLFGLGSQLVNIDAQKAFERLMPVLQQMAQTAATYAPQPPLDPASQVYKETSLAETQRKAARDAKELELQSEKADTDAILRIKDQQIRVAMDAADNLTEERIKTAELSQDASVLKHEQEKTALTALKEAQSTLGGPNGQY
jgi:hypothetical protein